MLAIPFIAFVLVSIVVHISAFPSNATIFDLGQTAREVLTHATPAAPHFLVYADAYDGTTGPPAASAIKVKLLPFSSESAIHTIPQGFNVL